MEENKKTSFGKFHDRYYKILLFIPIILFIASISYLTYFYSVNNDFMNKDISLTGGTSVTIPGNLDSLKLESDLEGKLDSLKVRTISDLISGEQIASVILTKSDSNTTRYVLENYLGYTLTPENSSFEFTGSSLSNSFYNQLILALFFSFLFMSVVIFIIFRSFVPSSAVVISGLADMIMTLAFVNYLGMEFSSAGIVALLMLIGYSVDTDILLTNRVLKRKGNINERLYGAFKTGITMTLTSLAAVLSALFVARSFSVVLTQIFTILSIGLFFDILNTWITNVSILKWYDQKKNVGGLNG